MEERIGKQYHDLKSIDRRVQQGTPIFKIDSLMQSDEVKKKTILILVDWFAPGYKAGGPIQSCVNVSFALKDDFTIFVFTSDRDFGDTKGYDNIKTDCWTNDIDPNIKVFYATKAWRSMTRMREVFLSIKPDFIYLNHLFSPEFVILPLWLKFRNRIPGKMVLSPRGALYESALSVKRYKKAPFLLLFKLLRMNRLVRFHATNAREKAAILQYFPGSEVLIADNLPNTRQLAFESVTKNPGTLKLIFIARIHPIKNPLLLLRALHPVKAQVQLTIVGPMEDEPYWEKCLTEIKSLPGNIRVEYAGPVPNHALPGWLQKHHLFALPTTGENFGHAIFESLLSGRPLLISDQTPWLKLQQAKVGWDLPLEPAEGFTAAIESAAAWDQATFDDHAIHAWNYAHQFISNPELKKQYLDLFYD